MKVVTLEFAGIKFKSKAITGLNYIKAVVTDYLEKIIESMPQVKQIVVVEEKYTFTPDMLKAATRSQRMKATQSIHHLKTSTEMLSAETFKREACATSTEGKSLI